MISAVREKLSDEIKPVSAEQSRTRDNNEAFYGAQRGIDGNQGTAAYVSIGSDPMSWYKVKFDGLKCIDQIKWYWGFSGSTVLTWDCDSSGCGKCTGHSKCQSGSFTVDVSIEGATRYNLRDTSNCVYANTFELQYNGNLWIHEIAFTGNEVKSTSKL